MQLYLAVPPEVIWKGNGRTTKILLFSPQNNKSFLNLDFLNCSFKFSSCSFCVENDCPNPIGAQETWKVSG